MQKVKAQPQFTEGPIFSKIFLFAVPIIFTGLLQQLYNLADSVVVGRFSGDPNALAAVGSTSSFNNLILNLAIGISTGCGVLVAQFYGAKQKKELSRTVHTGISIALLLGILLGAIGLIVARPVLTLMGTKPEIIEQATLYISIIFWGLPATIVYNFGASILRAIGDSKTPLIILSLTGIVNVVLNLYFVIAMNMSVAGVATATIISQYLSAIAVVTVLCLTKNEYRFSFKHICIDKAIFLKMLRIGIPSGIQGSLFSISNMTIQSAINTFPPTAISGNTAGIQIESFVYVVMNSFYQATINIVGQNYGAGKMKRANKVLLYALIQVSTAGLLISLAGITFAKELSALFVDMSEAHAPQIVDAAIIRLRAVLPLYFFCGVMEVLSGYLRGLGNSFIPMVSSLLGACVLRIFWVLVIFPLEAFNSPSGLYLVMPISWIFTCILHTVTIIYTDLSMKKKRPELYTEALKVKNA